MATPTTFTFAERLRLASYRAAIGAGFYTDAHAEDSCFSNEDFHALTSTEADGVVIDYPFTENELVGLRQCKQAVAAGLHHEG